MAAHGKCPKCGAEGEGYQWTEQFCSIQYTALFGDGEVVDYTISHGRPYPKTVVCNACGRRMPREIAEAPSEGGLK